MPSLRKRMSSYFRQLSFHNEPRDRKHNTVNENSFVTKYLEGRVSLKEGSPIIYGKNPTDLPSYELGEYSSGSDTIIGCYSGPNGGLTTVKRIEKHLSVLDADIDFIDTYEEEIVIPAVPKKCCQPQKQPIDNTTMVINVAGTKYCVTNKPRRHSLGSIKDFQIEKTKIDKSIIDNNNCKNVECKNQLTNNICNNLEKAKVKEEKKCDNLVEKKEKMDSYKLSKSKSDGNPFRNRKQGKIIKINRPNIREQATEKDTITESDFNLPTEWNKKSNLFYGISNSLYDKNQITRHKNGDPIADCFGLIARKDSAILAVADGVNWGEKASIAAKSAVHGSLHYLNKTIFNDVEPFENLTVKTDESSAPSSGNYQRLTNTREVFICLLRAFNCAHDLILENKGMLTTLTVAVVLPLKRKVKLNEEQEERVVEETQYVCCVCNVGDTLAYVYSQQFGIRELTKGSHDINCNRDMRDALGALGPVDGINPELSNLTISITILQKGDIVLIASDGLTDNFDPNVCKYTVNSSDATSKTRNSLKKTNDNTKKFESRPPRSEKPPIKPPRKIKNDVKSDTNIEKKSVKENDVHVDVENPLVVQFMRENSLDEKKTGAVADKSASLKPRQLSITQTKNEIKPDIKSQESSIKKSDGAGYKFLRSKTTIDMRNNTSLKPVLRNEEGVPYVTPVQRYELQLLLMEDVLKNGISGKEPPCTTSQKLCENLLNYVTSITSAKRRTLEDQDLYYDNRNGVLVEISGLEKKIRRKRGLERVQNLPGKLDHVTIVAYNVGNYAHI